MKDVSAVLKHFGLSPLEVDIYLSLIELGASPVSTLANKAKVKRTNAYNILGKLAKRGLISEFPKGHIRYFQAIEPQKLITLQEQHKRNVEQNIERLKEIVPILEGMQNPTLAQPTVRFYQRKEGIEKLLEQILNYESYDAYFNPKIACNIFPHAVDVFLENGDKKALKIRELIVPSTDTTRYVKKIKNPNHQYKILPKKYKIFSDTIIYGDSVAFISYLEATIAVVIDSKDISNSQRMAFELMWGAVS